MTEQFFTLQTRNGRYLTWNHGFTMDIAKAAKYAEGQLLRVRKQCRWKDLVDRPYYLIATTGKKGSAT